MNTNSIGIHFQSTPHLWAAYRDGLCWCGSCAPRQNRGLGKTPAEALAHLLEQELDAEIVASNDIGDAVA